MTSSTTPDNLTFWTLSDPQALPTASSAMMTSVQAALSKRERYTYYWPTPTDKAAEVGMRQGDIGYLVSSKTEYIYDSGAWVLYNAPSPLSSVALSTGYINQGYTLQTQRVGSQVHLHGRVTRTSGTSTTVGVIDADHWPDNDQIITTLALNPGTLVGTQFSVSVPATTGAINLNQLDGGPTWTTGTWIFINMWWVCTK